jgi:hypothetical protein
MRLAERMEGGTRRQHLLALQAQSGITDPDLAVALPDEADSLWAAYIQLSAARPRGFGASGIPMGEIDAWQRLHGVRLTPWEVDTLSAMDAAALAAQAAMQDEKGGKK